ncbi:DUF1826 domain-containing protein [Bacterioplanoides sp.]|uniref:DUF1826 domain-containing protein n=1 Tax=Bacterioplanoides sp. TaxID=2066072 RepID=UPI003B59A10C
MASSAIACNVANNLKGDTPEVLPLIYQDGINLIQWQRPENPKVREYAQYLTSNSSHFSVFKNRLEPESAADILQKELPEHLYKQDFIDDFVLLVDMFCTLFELPAALARVSVLDSAMCPKFHTDKVPCRLVSSFCGAGTEWLENHQVRRHKMGHNTQGKSDKDAGVFIHQRFIQQVGTQDVVLLKGEAWEGNEQNGAVHRSPMPVAGESRLLLTLDFSD